MPKPKTPKLTPATIAQALGTPLPPLALACVHAYGERVCEHCCAGIARRIEVNHVISSLQGRKGPHRAPSRKLALPAPCPHGCKTKSDCLYRSGCPHARSGVR